MISYKFHALFEELLKRISYEDLIELDNCFNTIHNLYCDVAFEIKKREGKRND